MSKDDKFITSFIPVFEDRLLKIKKNLKIELERAKSDRRKDFIKKELKEAKELRNIIKKAVKKSVCPHCGGDISG